MKKLRLKEAKILVWATWGLVLIGGGIAAFAIDSKNWIILLASLLVVLWTVIRFFNKCKLIPKRTYSVVPTIFRPSAFFCLIIALVLICKSYGEIELHTIEIGVMSIIFWILSIPESRY